MKLRYNTGIWPDISILCINLSDRIKWKLFSKLNLIEDPQETEAIIPVLTSIADYYSVNPTHLEANEHTYLFRAIYRILQLLNHPQWIRSIKTDDLVLQIYQISNNPDISLVEIEEKILPVMGNFEIESDPESNLIKIGFNQLKFIIANGLGNFDQIPDLVASTQQLYQNNSQNHLYGYLYGQFLAGVEWFYWENGELERAVKIIEEIEEIELKIKSNRLQTFVQNAWGAYYSHLGQVEKAVIHFKKNQVINQEIGNRQGEIVALTNMSDALLKTGAFSEVITVLEEASIKNDIIIKNRNLTNNSTQIVIWNNLAEAYQAIGDLDKALGFAKQANNALNPKRHFNYVNNEVRKTYMDILLDLGRFEVTDQILTELKELLVEHPKDTLYLSYHYYLGRIQFLKQNTHEAHQNFLEALKYASKIRSITTQIQIQLQLAQLFLHEFTKSQNHEILPMVAKFVENVIIAALDQEFDYLLCKSLLMKATIEQIQEEYRQALNTLEEAKKVAIDYKIELDLIQEKIDELNNKKQTGKFETQSEFLKDSLNQLSQSFTLSKNKSTKLVESKIYAVIVIDTSGVPIYTHYVDKDLNEKNMFISGLLAAINSFSTQLLNQSDTGALKTIRHENMDILLERKDNQLIALISDKDTFELRNQMLQLCNIIPKIKGEDRLNEPDAHKEELDVVFSQIFMKY